MPRRDPAIKVDDRTRAGLERVAREEGVTTDALAERWLQEKLDDDMRRKLRAAAGADEPDPRVVFDKTCAVTMFDMHVQILKDGRERGLWVLLKDDSPDRERHFQKALEAHIESRKKLWSAQSDDRRYSGGLMDKGALLEWPAAKALHAAIGKALRRR